jgi:hypothetical protein
MRLLVRVALLVSQLATFMVITVLLSYGFSLATAKHYVQGEMPSPLFPVVAVYYDTPKPTMVQYQLLRWPEIEKSLLAAAPPTFKLPERKGHFLMPKDGDFEPSVDFKVIESAGGRQTIEVISQHDDYEFHAKYATDGTSVSPTYLRTWGGTAIVYALIPGFILTWLLGRIVAWQWSKRAARPPAAA